MEKEPLIPKTNISSIFYSLASITLVISGLIYFNDILKPVIIAFLVWFIISQLKALIGKIEIKGKSLPNIVSNILAFIIIFLIVYFVAQILMSNLEGIVESMPEYISNLNKTYNNASAFINDPIYIEYLQKWGNSIDLSEMVTSMLNSFSGILVNIAVVTVYVIFFLIEETARKRKIEQLYPDKGKKFKKFSKNLTSISEAIRYYLWSKTLISLVTGIISYIILIIMGIEYAFLWSFLIFILNFIPYIGPLISSIFPAIFAVITKGELLQFVYVFGAMEVVQIIIGNFIQPMIMGKGTNLSPIVVIIALAFWGMLWGIVGMMLAVPIMAVIVIVCSQIPSTRYLAIFLSEKGEIPELEE
jgi:AI-2 transport protein TqsA